MNRDQFFSETVSSSITVDKSNDLDSPSNQSSKLMISVSCLIIAVTSASSPSIQAFEVSPPLTFHENQKKNTMLESNTTKISSQNFSNYNQENDTIDMNNDKLEVDDLAERVTQAQLDEIKSHFDTKILNLEEKLSIKIESVASQKTIELKEFIKNENKEIKEEKVNTTRFIIGNVVVPFVTVLLTLLGTKYFKLF